MPRKTKTTKAADWREGFRRALIDTLIEQGSPVGKSGDSFFGWIADDWASIARAVGAARAAGLVDYDRSSWTDAEWHEFMGTFYEGDTRKVGIDLTLVLTDGRTFTYRYTGTPGDLILSIVRDPE